MELEEYVAARGDQLLRFALLLCGNRELAEDVVQDVLVDLASRRASLDAINDLDAYFRRAIVNRRNSWWRRTARRTANERRAAEVAPESPIDVYPELIAACDALPERQRSAVILRFYEDRTFSDIASILGCREASARSLVHRALRSMRPLMQQADMKEIGL